jgi:invasion protein IalB
VNSLANWVAIASAALLTAAFILGVNLRPGPEHWPRPASGRAQLPLIIAFTPGPDFAGEHKFGLWTLFCRPGTPGAEMGTAPAAPAMPDLSADVPASIAAALRCVTHARIQVRAAGQAPKVLAEFNVFMVGSDRKPYVILNVPAKAKDGKLVNFQIDDNLMFSAPVGDCTGATCLVQGELPAAALTQMQAGKELRLRLYPGGAESPIDFGYPLHGFKESYQAMAFAQPVPEVAAPVPAQPGAAASGPPAE